MKLIEMFVRRVTASEQPLPEVAIDFARSRETALQRIEDLVGELTAVEALDGGSGATLDRLIKSWSDQHHRALEAFHLDVLSAREKRSALLNSKIALASDRLQKSVQMLSTFDEDGSASIETGHSVPRSGKDSVDAESAYTEDAAA